MKNYFFPFIALFLLVSCDLYKQDSYKQQYVVEAYLLSLKPLPEIDLSLTSPVNQFYDRAQLSIENAQVTVNEYDEDGTLTWTGSFSHSLQGRYTPDEAGKLVLPRRSYELVATIPPNGDILRAVTVVPDTFSLKAINATELPYQGIEQFRLTLTPSFYPGRQGYYIFSTRTLDPDNAEMTPFYAEFADSREESFVVSSGIINQASTRPNGGELVELTFPWIGVAFYGPNRIAAAAIDNNMYDFIRTIGIQQMGNQSPGEIENFISRVEGGIGIFGSYSEITVDVEVLKP